MRHHHNKFSEIIFEDIQNMDLPSICTINQHHKSSVTGSLLFTVYPQKFHNIIPSQHQRNRHLSSLSSTHSLNVNLPPGKSLLGMLRIVGEDKRHGSR